MYINYYIRSCDIIRHFRDDIYLACRLVYHLLDSLRQTAIYSEIEFWDNIQPGQLNMYITSLHCFHNEKELLKMENI